MKVRKTLLTSLLLLAAMPASAQLQSENLVSRQPGGYEVVLTETIENDTTVKMVPRGQTLDDARDILTVRVLRNSRDSEMEFRQKLLGSWARACPQNAITPIIAGAENGYGFTVDHLQCVGLEKSGELTNMLVKSIRGRTAIYSIQRTFKYGASEEDLLNWTDYLSQVFVCDNRIKAQACPHQ